MDRLEKDSRIYSKGYGKERVFRRKGVITPIQKGDTSDVRNYRRVTLLCTGIRSM